VEHEEMWDGRAIKPWVEDANVSQFAQRKERKAAFFPGGRNPFISHHSIPLLVQLLTFFNLRFGGTNKALLLAQHKLKSSSIHRGV